MTDLERRIRDALEGGARSAPAPHEVASVLRRTRRRQVLIAAGGALGVIALLAGSVVGVTAVMNDEGRRGEVPATPSTVTTTINGVSITHPEPWVVIDPDDAGLNSTPSDPPTLPRLVLALSPNEADEYFACPGLVEGDRPTFLMTVQEQPLALTGEAAAPWPVEPTPLGELDGTGCYPSWEFLGTEWTTAGRTFQARIGVSPSISGDDRQALLTAFASMTFETPAEPATSVVLTTGNAGGEAWQLVAERQGEELVLSLDAETFGTGGGAGFDPGAGRLTAMSAVVGNGEDATRIVFGAVPGSAVRLEVRVSGEGPSSSGAWEILDIPDEIGADLDAFVFTIGEGQIATVDAFDDADSLIASGEAGPFNDPVGTPPPTLPVETLPEHGGTYWGLYLAAAASLGDPEIERWIDRMDTIGYTPSAGDLACDDGAAEVLGIDPGWSRVAVYFDNREDAETAAGTIEISLELGTPVGVARVTTYCLD